MAGFGTIVTGTLTDGHLTTGEEVEILPSRLKARIRGLQTHKKKEEIAIPGSRTAINLAGADAEQIQRGEVVVQPGQYQITQRLDVQFRLLKEALGPLHHHSEVKFFLGTSETIADIRLLGAEVLNPGETGWLQLDLHQPVVAVRGDRYILRRPSPPETLGGGTVMDPYPKDRHKRFNGDVVKRLESLLNGTPADVLLQASLALGPAMVKDVVTRSRLEVREAAQALEELISTGQLISLEDVALTVESTGMVVALPQWLALKETVETALAVYHQTYPLRHGIPREELKSRLKLSPRVFNAILHKFAAQSVLVESAKWAALPDHRVRFSPFQQVKVDRLMEKFVAASFAPPTIKECQDEVGEDVFSTLLDSGDLVAVSAEVAFRKDDFELMVGKIRLLLEQKGQISLAEVRDMFKTSRRYVQALLEYLDSTGMTIRQGDFRRLKR
jgi:selenocysteine-specific elongation factor